MKKIFAALVILLLVASTVYAADVGLQFKRDMNAAAGTNPDSYGIIIRNFGGHSLGFELSATTPSTLSPVGSVFDNFGYLVSHLGDIQTVNIAPYLLFNYKVDPTILYAGIAPTISVSKPWPTFDFSFKTYSVKAGIQANVLFFGAYAEAITNLTLEPSFSMFQAYQVDLGAVLRF